MATGPESAQFITGSEINARVAVGFDLVGSAAPEWIQVMPSGVHDICASQGGKPVKLRVRVGPETASALQRALQHHISTSRQRPFFDFDHERKAASSWPLEFVWRDDPEPGVYARVEWSDAGRAAVTGKSYRAFSPTFYISAGVPAEVSGAPICMGALVNDPAFKTIRPIWAANITNTMTFEEWLKAEFGLTDAEIDLLNNAESLPDDFTLDASAGSDGRAVNAYSPYQPRDELGRFTDSEGATFRQSDAFRMITKKIAAAKGARTKADLIKARTQLRAQFNEWKRERADASHSQPSYALQGIHPNMNTTELAALQARIAELESKNAELEANAASTEATQVVQAFAAEKAELAEKVEALNREIAARNQRDARAIVASVAAVNPVFAKDIQAQEAWVAKIIANPADAELLRKAYPKPAVVEAARRIITPKVDITRESTRDCIRGYVQASTPREKGWFYHRNLSPRINDGEDVLGQIPVDANSLGTVANAIVSQRVLELVVSKRPMLKGVVTDFSDEVASKGDIVKTRTIGLPTVQNFGTSASSAADSDVTVTLDLHKEVYYSFSGAEVASTRRDLVGERAEAMAVALGNSMVDAMAALITEANFGTLNQTTQASGWDFSTITAICKGMNNAGIPDVGRFAWVTEDVAEALVNDQTLLEYVDKSTARSAYSVWTNVKGFTNIWEYPAMPQTNNIVGFFASRSALIVSARIPRTGADLLGTSYAGTLTTVTDPVSGFSVLRNEWIEPSTLAANARLITLYGVDVGNAACGWTLQTS